MHDNCHGEDWDSRCKLTKDGVRVCASQSCQSRQSLLPSRMLLRLQQEKGTPIALPLECTAGCPTDFEIRLHLRGSVDCANRLGQSPGLGFDGFHVGALEQEPGSLLRLGLALGGTGASRAPTKGAPGAEGDGRDGLKIEFR